MTALQAGLGIDIPSHPVVPLSAARQADACVGSKPVRPAAMLLEKR
jgi:hypothetical protein